MVTKEATTEDVWRYVGRVNAIDETKYISWALSDIAGLYGWLIGRWSFTEA